MLLSYRNENNYRCVLRGGIRMGWRSSLGIQADFSVKVTLNCEGKGIEWVVPISTGPYCHLP